jgi:hypothetical protein
MKNFIAFVASWALASHALAGEFKPIVIETASAKAYVVPPAFRWSQDEKFIAIMDADRKARWRPIQFYGVPRARDSRGQMKSLRFDEKETDVSVLAFLKEVKSRGMSIQNSTNFYNTQEPVRMDKDALTAFRAQQNAAYLAWSKSASPVGDRKMTGREIVGKTLLGGLALGVFVLTRVDVSSSMGSSMSDFRPGLTAGMPLSKDAGFPLNYEVGAMPAYALDLDGFDHIDYRPFMTFREKEFWVHGEIIIAYRGAKTKEAEDEILPLAWIAASAIDLTDEQIKEARDIEKAHRVALWQTCVDAGECK